MQNSPQQEQLFSQDAGFYCKNFRSPFAGLFQAKPYDVRFKPMNASSGLIAARIGAICYIAWGLFHINVSHDIYLLGVAQQGIAQGRTYQLAVYMLTISLFVICVAALLNWKNSKMGFWLNFCVAGWADLVWVLVVVIPGYVGAARGLIPPAIFTAGAILTALARRSAMSTASPHN